MCNSCFLSLVLCYNSVKFSCYLLGGIDGPNLPVTTRAPLPRRQSRNRDTGCASSLSRDLRFASPCVLGERSHLGRLRLGNVCALFCAFRGGVSNHRLIASGNGNIHNRDKMPGVAWPGQRVLLTTSGSPWAAGGSTILSAWYDWQEIFAGGMVGYFCRFTLGPKARRVHRLDSVVVYVDYASVRIYPPPEKSDILIAKEGIELAALKGSTVNINILSNYVSQKDAARIVARYDWCQRSSKKQRCNSPLPENIWAVKTAARWRLCTASTRE